ncbi:MAG: hypothetical protein HY776_01440 [Actinobacteria bacterium]|nr:hypothetical protein [Actinomycetota bacterium]
MEIQKNLMVPLGYGKYFRSDKIVGLERIEEGRGPQRRTYVYIEGIKEPLIASRGESTILRDIVGSPEALISSQAIELMEMILDEFREIGPMLRRSIKEEAGLDLDEIETKIRKLLLAEKEEDIQEQRLF